MMPEFHELANVFPMLSAAELEALARDIAENGQRHAITLYQGKILDGRNRYAACELAGVEPRYTEYTGDNPLAFVVSENISRRHLDESQRAMCAARLATLGHGQRADYADASFDASVTQPQAAEMLNVSRPSVQRAAQVISNGIPELVKAVECGYVSVSRAAQIAAMPEQKQREAEAIGFGVKKCQNCNEMYNDTLFGCPNCTPSGFDKVLKPVRSEIVKAHVAYNSGDNEWYTPAEYIEAARRVMGKIDLDPASSRSANKTVGADRFFTVMDNGLDQKWSGKVWMNPPYSSDLVGRFSEKIRAHYEAGEITEAIVLVNNATETAWFRHMVGAASAVAFTNSRVRFLDEDLDPVGAPLQGQAVIYFGENVNAFRKEFSALCWSATI